MVQQEATQADLEKLEFEFLQAQIIANEALIRYLKRIKLSLTLSE